LPNGSVWKGTLPQVLKAQQHRQHPFQLAVEVDLVSAEPLKLFRVEGFPERLFAEQRMIGNCLSTILEPREHLALDEASQTMDVGGGGFLVLLEFIGLKLERVGPPLLRIFL